MADKKVLVLNPLTGELQQLQTGDTVFGLSNGQSVPTLISDAVSAEKTRAEGAEAALQTAIGAEKTRAEGAEAALQTAIGNEVARAEGAEAALQTELDAVVSSVGLAADGTLEGVTFTNSAAGATSIVAAINAVAADAAASGSGLQGEVDAIEAAAGLATGGTYIANTGTNYINGATTLAGADVLLDAAIKFEADRAIAAEGVLTTNLAAEVARATDAEADLQTELDATQAGAGLNADGTYTANEEANYIGTATSLVDADNKLDAAIKVNADAIASEAAARISADAALDGRVDTLEASVDTGRLSQSSLDARYVNVDGDTMTGALLFSGAGAIISQPTQAATKEYVDSLAGGLSWQEPVVGVGAALPATATAGDRFVNTTDGKVYTATAADTWDAGVAPQDGFALFDKSTETGYVFSGTAWVQFTGTGQLTAGLGIKKTNNRLDVELAAGGALSFAPAEAGTIETNSAITLNTSAEFSQNGGTLSLVDASIANAKLTNSTIAFGDGTESVEVALGAQLDIVGDEASGINTLVVGSQLKISASDATATTKGVASFDAGSFAVTAGAVSLAKVGTAGTYGSSTAIPVITTDANGRVTGVTTAAISTEYSFVPMTTTAAAVGDVVYAIGDNTAAPAIATAASTAKAIGFVVAAGQVATSGAVTMSGLTASKRYFVSDVTAGKLIEEGSAEFTTLIGSSHWLAPVGIALSSTKLSIQIGATIGL